MGRLCEQCAFNLEEAIEGERKKHGLALDTLHHIKTTLADYKSQPEIGFQVVKTLVEGMRK